LKSLSGQTARKNFEIVVLVKEEHKQIATPCTKVAEDAGAIILYGERLEELRKRYAHKCKDDDWFIVTHIDSDDMYAMDAMKIVEEQKMSDGLVLVFVDGYMLDTQMGAMWECLCGSAPLSYFSIVYSGASLKTEDAFHSYRAKHGLDFFHYQALSCKNKIALPKWKFCSTMNGSNITSVPTNPRIISRLGKKVDPSVLDQFIGKEIVGGKSKR
jgi:hypothetical protein